MCKSMTMPISSIQESTTIALKPSCCSADDGTWSCDLSRKRVRFVEGDNNSECSISRPVKRRVIELEDVPPSSTMTDNERRTIWRQQEDYAATAEDVEHIIRSCQESDGETTRTPNAYISFAEALATTYNLCCTAAAADDNKNDDDDDDIDESNARRHLPLDQMILLGGHHAATRGLESKIIPGLGAHRYQKRKELVRGVLGIQEQFRATNTDQSDMAEGLSTVSQHLSKPSKRFARAMGVVDGTMALLDYAEDSVTPVIAPATAHLPSSCGGDSMETQDSVTVNSQQEVMA